MSWYFQILQQYVIKNIYGQVQLTAFYYNASLLFLAFEFILCNQHVQTFFEN